MTSTLVMLRGPVFGSVDNLVGDHVGLPEHSFLNREQTARFRITSEGEAIKTTSKSGSGQHQISLAPLLNCGVRAGPSVQSGM